MIKRIKGLFKNEKDSIVIKNIIAAFLIKGAALLVSLISLPIYIRYFENKEVLGVWFTILSVLIWILSFDFGIGNGLRNKLVSGIINNDTEEIRKDISSAYFVMGIISIITLIIGFVIIPTINWNTFFNISSELLSREVLTSVMHIVFATITLQFFLRIINFILYALQKSALNNFLALITSVTQVIIVSLLPSINTATNIKYLSMVYLITVNLPLIMATILVFRKDLLGMHPSFQYFNFKTSKDILHLGGIFFWNQIMYTALTGTNAFLISNFVGPRHVVDYQVYYRIFTLIGIVFNLALTPMWSAITKAFEESDNNWIKRYYKTLLKLSVFVFIVQILIIPFLQIMINLWLGDNSIRVSYAYAFAFALFGSIFVLQNILSTFACGIGKLRLQAFFYTIGVIIKILVSYYITKVYPSWIVIVIADILVVFPYCIFQALDLKKRLGVNNF